MHTGHADTTLETIIQEAFHSHRVRRLLTILSDMPATVWARAIVQAPEYQYFKPVLITLSAHNAPNLLLITELIAGLNAFQLKYPPETKYWQALAQHILNQQKMTNNWTPSTLYQIFYTFYQHERIPTIKLARLHKVFHSPLMDIFLRWTPEQIHAQFAWIYQQVGRTLNQPSTAKTIAFAAKTLAIGLRLCGYPFPEMDLPIPVDNRIERLTRRLIPELLQRVGSHRKQVTIIQVFWQAVLSWLRERGLGVTMIHLDSLLWWVWGAFGAGVQGVRAGAQVRPCPNSLNTSPERTPNPPPHSSLHRLQHLLRTEKHP